MVCRKCVLLDRIKTKEQGEDWTGWERTRVIVLCVLVTALRCRSDGEEGKRGFVCSGCSVLSAEVARRGERRTERSSEAPHCGLCGHFWRTLRKASAALAGKDPQHWSFLSYPPYVFFLFTWAFPMALTRMGAVLSPSRSFEN